MSRKEILFYLNNFSVFFPALQGAQTKMSASDATSSIFLTDSANEVKKKINKYAFSGGQVDVETHRKLGGNTDKDIAYQYLRFFCDDDKEVEEIGEKYRKGIKKSFKFTNFKLQPVNDQIS